MGTFFLMIMCTAFSIAAYTTIKFNDNYAADLSVYKYVSTTNWDQAKKDWSR